MRPSILLSILIFLMLFSCDSSRTQETPQNETPKALEDKTSSSEIVSKRGYNDLIESLYEELVEKTPDLKELETQIDKLAGSKSDSLEQFSKYNGKNQSYYQSAIKLVRMFAGKPMAALDVVLVYVVPQEKNKTVANTRLINFNFILNYFKLRVTFCPQLFKHFAKEKFTNGLIFWNVC